LRNYNDVTSSLGVAVCRVNEATSPLSTCDVSTFS
jgi:hypothetical protein